MIPMGLAAAVAAVLLAQLGMPLWVVYPSLFAVGFWWAFPPADQPGQLGCRCRDCERLGQ